MKNVNIPVIVTLEFNGKMYVFMDRHRYAETDWEYNEETDDRRAYFARYWWTEGNGSCDCNRANYIRHYCDPEFPEFNCSDDRIILVNIEILPDEATQ